MSATYAVLAKENNGQYEQIYPKTNAEIVEYTSDVTVKDKLDSINGDIVDINNRINNINTSGTGGGSSNVTVDATLNNYSTNPIQNRTVYEALSLKSDVTHTHDKATTIADGLMSKEDKIKLNNINLDELGGSNITVDKSISSSSTNPVQNKAVYNALITKSDSNHSHTPLSIGAAANVHSHSLATTSTSGFMSAEDKQKLDSIDPNNFSGGGESDTSNNTLDVSLNSTSTNAVQNKVIYTALQSKASIEHTHTAEDVGAATRNHSHSVSDIGAAAASHSHTPSEIGAAASSHSHSVASTTTNGFMSSTDKSNLDNLNTKFGNTTIDTNLSNTSTNLVQNKVIKAALDSKAAGDHTHTASDVGASPAGHTHSLSSLGAAASNHTHTASDVGAAASTHTHTPASIGAATSGHSHSNASSTAAGFMSVNDKNNLDSLYNKFNDFTPDNKFNKSGHGNQSANYLTTDTSGNLTFAAIDTSLSSSSTKPVQNKVVKAALDGKAASSHSHTPSSIGAAASNHTHTASDVGAASSSHSHTPSSIGAAASSHSHSNATTSAAGFMSKDDKSKLDSISGLSGRYIRAESKSAIDANIKVLTFISDVGSTYTPQYGDTIVIKLTNGNSVTDSVKIQYGDTVSEYIHSTYDACRATVTNYNFPTVKANSFIVIAYLDGGFYCNSSYAKGCNNNFGVVKLVDDYLVSPYSAESSGTATAPKYIENALKYYSKYVSCRIVASCSTAADTAIKEITLHTLQTTYTPKNLDILHIYFRYSPTALTHFTINDTDYSVSLFGTNTGKNSYSSVYKPSILDGTYTYLEFIYLGSTFYLYNAVNLASTSVPGNVYLLDSISDTSSSAFKVPTEKAVQQYVTSKINSINSGSSSSGSTNTTTTTTTATTPNWTRLSTISDPESAASHSYTAASGYKKLMFKVNTPASANFSAHKDVTLSISDTLVLTLTNGLKNATRHTVVATVDMTNLTADISTSVYTKSGSSYMQTPDPTYIRGDISYDVASLTIGANLPKVTIGTNHTNFPSGCTIEIFGLK